MTVGTFHSWVFLERDMAVYLTLSVFCGQLEVSIDAAALHKPLEPLTVCAGYCFMMWNGAASWTNTGGGIVGTNLIWLRVFGSWCQIEIAQCWIVLDVWLCVFELDSRASCDARLWLIDVTFNTADQKQVFFQISWTNFSGYFQINNTEQTPNYSQLKHQKIFDQTRPKHYQILDQTSTKTPKNIGPNQV